MSTYIKVPKGTTVSLIYDVSTYTGASECTIKSLSDMFFDVRELDGNKNTDDTVFAYMYPKNSIPLYKGSSIDGIMFWKKDCVALLDIETTA